MKASAFLSLIDRARDARRSILLRYWPLLERGGAPCGRGAVADISGGEGVEVRPFLTYGGVRIELLDETTGMASGTMKSVEACLTVAACAESGARELVFESGGNAGTALTMYAGRAGLRPVFVVPAENVRHLSAEALRVDGRLLIAVRKAASAKAVADRLTRRLDAPRVPDLKLRYLAGMARGYFVAETIQQGARFDWFSQTVSGGFGPIGVFRALRTIDEAWRARPRLLAVQQEENAPYTRSWLGEPPAGRPAARLTLPWMYDRDPFSHGAFDEFSSLLHDRGAAITVSRRELAHGLRRQVGGRDLLSHLMQAGVILSRRAGTVADKTGLLGLVGVLKAIDTGVASPGEVVLHAMTSGTFRPGPPPQPDLTLRDESELDPAWSRLGSAAAPRSSRRLPDLSAAA